jgi:hypothetical protein
MNSACELCEAGEECLNLSPWIMQYYLKPFHAYDNGNLSWDAALEVELAVKSVHANVFDPKVIFL